MSQEFILFEGVARPNTLLMIHDGSIKSPEDIAVLERYFIDIQNLFFKRLSGFSSDGESSSVGEDATRLRALLDEIIKVKNLIQSAEVRGAVANTK